MARTILDLFALQSELLTERAVIEVLAHAHEPEKPLRAALAREHEIFLAALAPDVRALLETEIGP